jgi:RNA polymerase sigma-70 factor (ECF subfamily)
VADETKGRGGDERLFVELAPGLRRFAAVVRPPEMEADDLVQEALARTLARRSLSSLDNPGAYLRTSIVRVASNVTRSRRRERARLELVAEREPGRDDSYPSDLAELMRVPVTARAVLYLSVIEGRSYREIAPIVGCSEVNARALASRALRDLRVEQGAQP